MFKKIKLFKKVLDLSKEIKKILKENEEALADLQQLFETAKILFPSLIGVLNEIVKLVKDDNN